MTPQWGHSAEPDCLNSISRTHMVGESWYYKLSSELHILLRRKPKEFWSWNFETAKETDYQQLMEIPLALMDWKN